MIQTLWKKPHNQQHIPLTYPHKASKCAESIPHHRVVLLRGGKNIKRRTKLCNHKWLYLKAPGPCVTFFPFAYEATRFGKVETEIYLYQTPTVREPSPNIITSKTNQIPPFDGGNEIMFYCNHRQVSHHAPASGCENVDFHHHRLGEEKWWITIPLRGVAKGIK